MNEPLAVRVIGRVRQLPNNPCRHLWIDRPWLTLIHWPSVVPAQNSETMNNCPLSSLVSKTERYWGDKSLQRDAR
ncbi:MAG: hypothetical protein R3B91_00925 [Planctomycetaceae bacterium]